MNALSASDILTREEIMLCLQRLRRSRVQHRKYPQTMQNEVIFRLAVCCGLRVSEMSQLNITNVNTCPPKPAITLPKGIVKGKRRMRSVPLWWDEENRSVLEWWIEYRRAQGAGPDDPVVCSQQIGLVGKRRSRTQIAGRWKSAISCLGKERQRQLSIHCGRHSFASHALNVGRSLVEVQTALGHSNIGITSIYLHLIERENIPNLYS